MTALNLQFKLFNQNVIEFNENLKHSSKIMRKIILYATVSMVLFSSLTLLTGQNHPCKQSFKWRRFPMRIDLFLRGLIFFILHEENLKIMCLSQFSHGFKDLWPKISLTTVIDTDATSRWEYDVSKLTENLNLQACTIVEVGEQFCSLFVDFPTEYSDKPLEIFLGLCRCSAMRDWKFCNSFLSKDRKQDCEFLEATPTANSSARVHRRLCDITGIHSWNERCNCEEEFAGQYLLPVVGFNTCFRPPLPESICTPRSVCGVAGCLTKSLQQIEIVQCDENCLGRQPFCEEVGPETSAERKITSFWSSWSSGECLEGKLASTAVCINSQTGESAFDCIGPDSNCCPLGEKDCYCKVWVNSTALFVTRFLASTACLLAEEKFSKKNLKSIERARHTAIDNSMTNFMTNFSSSRSSVMDLLIQSALQQLNSYKVMKSAHSFFKNQTYQ